MEGLGKYLRIPKKEAEKPKRGGVNSYISELRAETAKMLKEPFGKVAGLTRGFNHIQLKRMLDASNSWPNPPALWWKMYKEEKKYAKKQVRGVRRVGERGGRKAETLETQGVLFPDREERR